MGDRDVAEVARIKQVLVTLIAWLPLSANAPLRVDEAQQLLKMLQSDDEAQDVEVSKG